MDNLWGANIQDAVAKLPIQHFREQAGILSNVTKGIVIGDCNAALSSNRVEASLDIVAPKLKNYRLQVAFSTYQLASPYPCRLVDVLSQKGIEVKSEPDFVQELAKILQSEKVRSAVASLIKTSNASL
jgi:hypothetical protein